MVIDSHLNYEDYEDYSLELLENLSFNIGDINKSIFDIEINDYHIIINHKKTSTSFSICCNELKLLFEKSNDSYKKYSLDDFLNDNECILEDYIINYFMRYDENPILNSLSKISHNINNSILLLASKYLEKNTIIEVIKNDPKILIHNGISIFGESPCPFINFASGGEVVDDSVKTYFYLFLSSYNLHIYFSLEGEGTLYGGGGNIEDVIIKDVKISVFDLIDLIDKNDFIYENLIDLAIENYLEIKQIDDLLNIEIFTDDMLNKYYLSKYKQQIELKLR